MQCISGLYGGDCGISRPMSTREGGYRVIKVDVCMDTYSTVLQMCKDITKHLGIGKRYLDIRVNAYPARVSTTGVLKQFDTTWPVFTLFLSTITSP